jgi:hypothetical protein
VQPPKLNVREAEDGEFDLQANHIRAMVHRRLLFASDALNTLVRETSFRYLLPASDALFAHIHSESGDARRAWACADPEGGGAASKKISDALALPDVKGLHDPQLAPHIVLTTLQYMSKQLSEFDFVGQFVVLMDCEPHVAYTRIRKYLSDRIKNPPPMLLVRSKETFVAYRNDQPGSFDRLERYETLDDGVHAWCVHMRDARAYKLFLSKTVKAFVDDVLQWTPDDAATDLLKRKAGTEAVAAELKPID